MKKTLLVAALVAGFAGMASASTVTLSGELSAKVKGTLSAVDTAGVKGVQVAFAPAVEASFALSGEEDLSNGLKAVFELGAEADIAGKTFSVSSAYVGLSSELGTFTVGQQDGEVYTADSLLPGPLDVAHPLAKYVGKFGDAKVAVNVANFEGVLTAGALNAPGQSGAGFLGAMNVLPVSVSAEYTMYGVTGGLTLAAAAPLYNSGNPQQVDDPAHLGAALQLGYNYQDMLTVKAGYSYTFDVVDAVEVPAPEGLTETVKVPTNKTKIDEAVAANLGRHHHRAFLAVGGGYKFNDMSKVEAKAKFAYGYNTAVYFADPRNNKPLQHAFKGTLNVDYTYAMSKRTEVGVGLEVNTPMFVTTGEKAPKASVDLLGGWTSSLEVSLTHKF